MMEYINYLLDDEGLKDQKWKTYKGKEVISITCRMKDINFGEIQYTLRVDRASPVWLRVSQYHKESNIQNEELLLVMIDWLPESPREIFREIWTTTFFNYPIRIGNFEKSSEEASP